MHLPEDQPEGGDLTTLPPTGCVELWATAAWQRVKREQPEQFTSRLTTARMHDYCLGSARNPTVGEENRGRP